ncbi:MAG: nitroreductase [Endomicrobiales bacterium]
MNVIEALKARFSCRAFTPEPVDRGTVTKILEAALRAPSWSDTQPWEVFAAAGESLERLRRAYAENYENNAPRRPDLPMPGKWPEAHKKRMDELAEKRFNALGIGRGDEEARRRLGAHNFRFFDAPAVIYLCMDRGLTPWSMFDLGAFSQSIMLAAEEHGLSTIPAVVLTAYPDLVRKELGIPEHLAVVIGVALGRCDREHPLNKVRSDRRPAEEAAVLKGF